MISRGATRGATLYKFLGDGGAATEQATAVDAAVRDNAQSAIANFGASRDPAGTDGENSGTADNRRAGDPAGVDRQRAVEGERGADGGADCRFDAAGAHGGGADGAAGVDDFLTAVLDD